jgi:hypothetical protein
MTRFEDTDGTAWVASALEEPTPRHHGRWYLVFHPADSPAAVLAMPEVRWQTRATAERTLRTMSVFELRRRLGTVRRRQTGTQPAGAAGDRNDAERAARIV